MQEPSILADIATRLENAGVPYFLTGSVALSCYVPRRTTIDIDIVIQVSRGDAGRMVALFEDDYYVDRRAVREAIGAWRSFNIIHFERAAKVDLIVAEPSTLVNERMDRRRLTVDGVPM